MIKILSFKQNFILFLLLQSSLFYGQNFPIVGFGDAANYTIGYYTVPGSSGLDLHWHGGIRFGDNTSSSVMQISNGNVGIGIPNPTSKFVVMNNGYGISFNPASTAAGLGFNRNALDGTIFNTAISAWQFSARDEMFSLEGYNGAPNQLFSVLKNGNVGIGTFSPVTKLDVRGNISVWNGNSANPDEHGQIVFENTNHGVRRIGNVIDIFTSGGTESGITFTPRSYNSSTGYYSNMIVGMKIAYDGNVGIGTLNPTSKLTVAGNINSREVKVTVDAGADFVFENNYNLPSLDSVDKYIKENKHLPEIASADEMKKDGINLSEMNIKLLQKVEELTLYSIEQNKKINKLEEQNKKLLDLEKRLEKIESNSK